jgi:hypothetical protein
MNYFKRLAASSLLALSACSTSAEIRTLARQTSPFVVATHASVPAVERAYAAQSARTVEEMTAYAGRKQEADQATGSTVLLWSLSKTEPDKRSLELLQRIRANDAAVLAGPAAPDAQTVSRPASTKIGEITKLTGLLRDIDQNKVGGFGAFARFGQSTWQELQKLNKDAEKAVAEGTASGTPAGP